MQLNVLKIYTSHHQKLSIPAVCSQSWFPIGNPSNFQQYTANPGLILRLHLSLASSSCKWELCLCFGQENKFHRQLFPGLILLPALKTRHTARLMPFLKLKPHRTLLYTTAHYPCHWGSLWPNQAHKIYSFVPQYLEKFHQNLLLLSPCSLLTLCMTWLLLLLQKFFILAIFIVIHWFFVGGSKGYEDGTASCKKFECQSCCCCSTKYCDILTISHSWKRGNSDGPLSSFVGSNPHNILEIWLHCKIA